MSQKHSEQYKIIGQAIKKISKTTRTYTGAVGGQSKH